MRALVNHYPPIEDVTRSGSAAVDATLSAREHVLVARYCRRTRSLHLSPSAQLAFGIAGPLSPSEVLQKLDRKDRRKGADFFGSTAKCGERLTVKLQPLVGEIGWIRAQIVFDDGDALEAMLVDVTAEHRNIEELVARNEMLFHTVELNPQLPWQCDVNAKVTAFTKRFEDLTGLTQEQLLGDGWPRIIHPHDIERAYIATEHSRTSGLPLDMRVRFRIADGSYRWFRSTCYPLRDKSDRIVRWHGYTEDIDDHVLIEEQIRWTAEHDPLTKLPNRMVFNRQLEAAVRKNAGLGEKVAILLADVDNFKDVNDILGHDAGDALLTAFAEVLMRALPDRAQLSRIGGDEFAVVLPFEGPTSALTDVCKSVFAALRDPITINGQSIECRVSIGASVFPFHGQSPTELFKNADIALYQAKARGRGQMTVFSVDMKQETQRRVAMINLGRKAVETDSIVPYYQLQVAVDGERPIGFEALLRRRDRQGRICAPSSIAAAFEDPGVAEALGDAMLKAVLADIRRAKDEEIDLGTVSVNFSTAEFRSATFVDRLTDRLSAAEMEFGEIMIEVTESVFLGRQVDTVAETIRTLDQLGFRIALDDFGTGYASLVHLRQLPVDTLKIDQSFIRTLADSRDDLAIVTAIINLGASLDLKIIAEGIETAQQLAILKGLNLRYGQGFHFAHPVPIADACALVAPARARELRRFGS